MRKLVLAGMSTMLMGGAAFGGVICSGDSASVAIDLSAEPVVDSISVLWDASWVGGDAGATVVIVDDGVKAAIGGSAAEKVKAMFEATGDLGDWSGRRVGDNAPYQNALPVSVTVEEGEGATMRFNVTPGDGTEPRAFLRIRK